jgi:GTP-binding protein
MEITKSEYVLSFPKYTLCPTGNIPEYVFIGRSNVGKSSLINMLTGRKDLARISKQPGKTGMINYYHINEEFYLVDLPGYGYAKRSKKTRSKWEKMISEYLELHKNVMNVFVLIDSNVPPQKIDVEFINWLGEKAIPFSLVYTKTDRLTANKAASNIGAIRRELRKYWNSLPPEFITSSENGKGKEDLLDYFEELNEVWRTLPGRS